MMDENMLYEIAQREFSKMRRVYSPSDEIVLVETFPFDLFYRSGQFSEDGGNSYDNCTRINLSQAGSKKIGLIDYISVHPDVRGLGFGKEMVGAAERIFKGVGINHSGILVSEIDNPSFWEKMGYLDSRTYYEMGQDRLDISIKALE